MQELRGAIRGSLITPAHPEYDEARATFNAVIDRRPALIVRCAGVDDVVRSLAYARTRSLPVAIRGGGHNVAGHAVCDDGLVIDLKDMHAVTVDAARSTARAEGGTTWAEFDAATQRHGLATPGGTFGTTGIAGLTLGGGIGHLMGSYGLSCDNLISAEVVTPAGDVLTANADVNTDLFWALRGGGGNFGVVTSFEYRMHRVSTVLGGLVIYPFAQAREVLRLLRELSTDGPDELTCMITLTSDPQSREKVVALAVCFNGPVDRGMPFIERIRSALPASHFDLRPRSYVEMQSVYPDLPFGLRHYWKGHFVRDLTDELIERTVEHFAMRRGKIGAILVEPLHGAARRVPADATAFSQREARYNVSALSVWEDPDTDAEEIAWARAYAGAAERYSVTGGGYLNYMAHDEPAERVRAAYGPAKFERLRELKRRYDPTNMLRFNQNIPPL